MTIQIERNGHAPWEEQTEVKPLAEQNGKGKSRMFFFYTVPTDAVIAYENAAKAFHLSVSAQTEDVTHSNNGEDLPPAGETYISFEQTGPTYTPTLEDVAEAIQSAIKETDIFRAKSTSNGRAIRPEEV